MPIIVLSARHQSSIKVAALDAGADDYVTKPFGMDELLPRMRRKLEDDASAPRHIITEPGIGYRLER